MELRDMLKVARHYNSVSPTWAPSNQCADQAQHLGAFLHAYFKPRY